MFYVVDCECVVVVGLLVGVSMVVLLVMCYL